MTVMQDLLSSRSGHWRDAFYWFLYAVVGSLLPIWGSIILFALLGTWPGWDFFFSHGEFYIYSASFLSPMLYILHKIARVTVITVLTYFFVVACAILFAGTAMSSVAQAETPIDLAFLKYSSYLLLLLSMAITYVSKVRENVRLSSDPETLRRSEVDELENEVNRLGE